MTKFKLGRHKASALTKKGAAVFITAAILALVMLFTACPQKAVSSKSAGPNVSSIFKTNGKGIITGYTCKEDELPKALVIPAKIEKEVITGIGGSAFRECTNLTSVQLPASLTTIGDFAFYGCKGLTSVQFPKSLTTIGGSVFYGCKGLTSVQFPKSLTKIDSSAFEGCKNLTSLDLSGCISFTTIGWWSFRECTSLTSVQLPASLTTIGGGAFSSCKGLTSVQFPESLTTIDEGAFKGCTGLTSVQLPANLTTIGGYAFSDSKLTSVQIPQSLTKIGAAAFSGCKGLTSAVFANTNGWIVYKDSKYKTKHADINSTALADSSKAAKYLREKTANGGYSDKYWKKS